MRQLILKRCVPLGVFVLAMTCVTPAVWADIYFPQIAAGGGYTTVVTLMHTDARSTATAAAGVLSFYNPDGSARTVTTAELGQGSQFNITIPVQGTRVVTVTNTGSLAVGTAIFKISNVSVGGVATYTLGNTSVGVINERARGTAYIPLITKNGFENGVAIQNPGSTPVNVRLNLIKPDGTVAQTVNPPGLNPLPPFGQFSKIVETDVGLTTVPANSVLEAEVQGSGQIAVLPLVIGNNYFSSGGIVNDSDMPLFFAHVVDGGSFTTTIRLVNPYNVTAVGYLRFYTQTGAPRPLPISGIGTTSAIQLSIPPGQNVVYTTLGTSSGVSVGMARIDASVPIGGLATLFYGDQHIGVPQVTAMRSGRIAVDTADGNVGVALATSAGSNVNLKLTLKDRDGNIVQSLTPSDLTPLNANGQYAKYVTDMGFANTANIKDDSLLVEVNGSGTFLPLALLQEGAFSSTATSRQRLYDPANLAGNYSGSWSMPAFGSSFGGTMSLNLTVDSSNNASVSATVSGNPGTFLSSIPVASATGTFNANGELFVEGPTYVRLHNDGAFTIFVGAKPGEIVSPTGGVAWLAFNGDISANRLEGVITLGETDGTTVSGTFSLSK